MSAPVVAIRPADLSRAEDGAAIADLLDSYARDPMGGGAPLPPAVVAALPARLAAHPTARAWLAFDGDAPVGVAVCFVGFSTFAAQPLINVHDLAVLASHRGRGIGRRLLETVAQAARELGCCKLTLEVRDDNARAQGLYKALGFGDGAAPYRFWTKML